MSDLILRYIYLKKIAIQNLRQMMGKRHIVLYGETERLL